MEAHDAMGDYDTEEFPLDCWCGTRAKDMENFGRTKNNSDYMFCRCRCGQMWIIDDDGGAADAENTWLQSPEGEYDVLTDEEQGYGIF